MWKPLVAIPAYHLADDRVARWPRGGYGVPAPFVECLRRAGARTAILSPGEPAEPEELLEPFDGLLLVGGGDVDPSRYGAPAGEHVYGVEPDRDELEIGLLLAADRLGVPTLCICRGMQVMNVAFGGTLHQHLPDVPGLLEHGVPVESTESIHDVKGDPKSRLFAATKSSRLSCSSHHHQGIDRLGDGLAATGWSQDGLVEAIERVSPMEHEWWMLGVQWHPEDTAEFDSPQQALFDCLVTLARWRGSRAIPGLHEGRDRLVQLVDPDPTWPAAFEKEADRIRERLGDLVVRIEHVGSTAVPDLAAKPVVDIQVSVRSLAPRSAYSERLIEAGYRLTADPLSPEHDFFTIGDDGQGARRFNVHVCAAGSDWERRHLAFRDWLRAHPEDAASYEALKRDLAATNPRDIYAYVDGKTGFVSSVEERALGRSPSGGEGRRGLGRRG